MPAGVIPRHELGQNFLTDSRLLRRQIEYAGVTTVSRALEIGPGPGVLTELLLQTGAHVAAIETDRQFEPRLDALRAAYPNLEVIWGNAVDVRFPDFDRAVANLPYKVALPLIFKLLEHPFHTAVVLVQARLAERLAAQPGEVGYSRLSVTVQRLAALRKLETVKRHLFVPPPAVDSIMLRLRRTRPRFTIPSDEGFRQLLDFLFLRRDSPVSAALHHLPKRDFEPASRAMPADLRDRVVSHLAPEDFGRIAMALDGARVPIPETSNEAKRKAQKRR